MFPSCAQCVFTGAQWFLKSFPSSQCVPQDVPNSHHTLSHCLGPKLSFHNLQRWPKGKHLHTSIWGVCNVSNSFFFFFSVIGQPKKIKIKLVAFPWNNFFWLMKNNFFGPWMFFSWCHLWQIYPSTPSSWGYCRIYQFHEATKSSICA